jgi:hypothetical protein
MVVIVAPAPAAAPPATPATPVVVLLLQEWLSPLNHLVVQTALIWEKAVLGPPDLLRVEAQPVALVMYL